MPQVSLHKSAFTIEGMSCASCVNSIENSLKNVPGVEADTLVVTLLPPKVTLRHNIRILSAERLVESIENMGFTVVQRTTEDVSKESTLGVLDQEQVEVVTLNVDGMTCASCVNSIESYVSKQPGIKRVVVNLLMGEANVIFHPFQIGVRDIIDMISSVGYSTTLKSLNELEKSGKPKNEADLYLREVLIASIFAIPAFFVGMFVMMFLSHEHPISKFLMQEILRGVTLEDLTMFLLATPVQFGLGYRFYKGSLKSLYYLKTANMDVLIALGTSVAYFFSVYSVLSNSWLGVHESTQFFETSVFLIFFILLGKFMESYAKGRTTDSIQELVSLAPDNAVLVTLQENDPNVILEEQEIDLRLVQVGDILKVTPGGRFPCDGVIIRGQSYVDESMLTGESDPIFKIVSKSVLSGTVNKSAMLLIKVQKVGSDTTLARIIRLVEDAQANRAPVQAFADKVSSIFVPLVIIISTLTFFGWLLTFKLKMLPETIIPISKSMILFCIEHAIAVLVIARPCALGLATPTAVMVGSGISAKHGILVKGGGAALEKSKFLKIVAFDKTGTLTYGLPSVTDYEVSQEKLPANLSANEFFNLVFEMESASDHPLARAVCRFAKEKRVNLYQAFTLGDVNEIGGKGLVASIYVDGFSDKMTLCLGNARWMTENHISTENHQSKIKLWQSLGKSIVFMGLSVENEQGYLMGMLAVADQIRPEAATIVSHLEMRGIEAWMITGDNDVTARAVAAQVGIKPNQIASQVLPHEKSDQIKRLQNRCLTTGGTVAMVGDGINDSIALASSDVGIAIGAGSDVAIESAQVVLVKSDLRDVILLIDIASRTFNRIRLNFVWAFAYNVLGIPLAAGVFYPSYRIDLAPWMAGLAMAFSSVSVIVSSLGLRLYKPPQLQ